jgi:uncharacterized protein (TIGR02284 family)
MTPQETIVELNGLIQTCKDGELGYATAASDIGNTELETVFSKYAAERRQFARNLQTEVERLGGNPEGAGSASGALLRGWMDVKSSLTGGSGAAIIATCETGEEFAVAAFAWVVKLNVAGQTRSLVEKQYKAVKEAHARLLRLKAEEAAGTKFQKSDSKR